MNSLTRRGFLKLGAAGSLVGLVGCKSDTLSIFGYQLGSEALYDRNIKTVFVHSFYNRTIETTPFRNWEIAITTEVVRQIEAITPFKVCSDPSRADTELIGTIVQIQKNVLNVTQQNTTREGEVVVSVDVVWRDLRDGKILSAPKKHRNPANAPSAILPNSTDPNPAPPFDSQVAQAPDTTVTPKADPVRIVAHGRYIMELGETISSAMQKAQIQLAQQIVSMMEKRW